MRVLAIDGGGIRGVIPAMVLAELEKQSGRAVWELFDLIAGTSTGGILALGLTVPAEARSARYGAAEMLELYEDEGPRIFRRRPIHTVFSLRGLVGQKYPSRGIDGVLERYFSDVTLSEALTDVMVPAYDIEQRARYWFKSRKAREDASDDMPMRDAARATSAAPTYFAPAWVRRPYRHRPLIDGGVYANNPALAAYVEARDAYGAHDIVLLSLGTGESTQPLSYEAARRWGLAHWARPILDVVFDGVSKEIHHSLRKLLPTERYVRMQTRLDGAKDQMDATDGQNLRMLKVKAEQLIFEHRERLDRLAAELVR